MIFAGPLSCQFIAQMVVVESQKVLGHTSLKPWTKFHFSINPKCIPFRKNVLFFFSYLKVDYISS
jgi:hypothetical protein